MDAGTNTDAGNGFDAGPRDSGPIDTGVDSGPVCAESPCRLLLPQCGCSTGQSCYVDSAGGRFCATTGTRNEGDSCVNDSACDPGLTCGGEPQGGCWRLCDDDTDCMGAGSYCNIDFPVGDRVCSRSCTPTTNVGCPSGWACAIGGNSSRWYTHCRELTGTLGDWQPCPTGSDTDCRAGTFCAMAPSGGMYCYPYCTTTGSECPSASSCYPNGAVIGGVTYGYCGYP
jgi:hypothetical protein